MKDDKFQANGMVHVHEKQNFCRCLLINPRRACARVTVLGLSVCLLPLFLGDGKLIRRTECTKRFGATLRRVL